MTLHIKTLLFMDNVRSHVSYFRIWYSQAAAASIAYQYAQCCSFMSAKTWHLFLMGTDIAASSALFEQAAGDCGDLSLW